MAYEITVRNEPIIVRQNADFSKIYNFSDEDGAVIPLTDCSFRAQIRAHQNKDSELLYTFDSEANDGSVEVDLLTGDVKFNIPIAACLTFNFKEAYWDATIKWADAKTDVFLTGLVTLKLGITVPNA